MLIAFVCLLLLALLSFILITVKAGALIAISVVVLSVTTSTLLVGWMVCLVKTAGQPNGGAADDVP